MLYLEFAECKRKYAQTQKDYDALISEQETLFARTQPKSVQFDRESVQNGSIGNAFDAYIIAKEQTKLDERIAESKVILENRGMLLKLKEQELRNSKEIYDRIYRMRYIDRISCNQIARSIGYSRSQIFRILDRMREKLQRCD